MDTTGQDTTPEKEWPVWAAAVLESMRSVPSISRAAKGVGIARQTVHALAQRDELFAVALHDARDEALDTIEEVMLLRARTGQPTKKTVTRTSQDKDGKPVVETTVTDEHHLSDTLAMFYLKRWRPEYRDTYRVEATGAGGGPIQIQTVDVIDARIAQLAGELARRSEPVEVDE